MSVKASLPRGMRDLLPADYRRREVLLQSIRRTYRRYGFQPIETPAMERLETLMGKYGDEGDRLLFKVLNSGDFLARAEEHQREAPDSRRLAREISEKGLRYDLTVPLARYVVQHQNELSFPFKRYQIQPVWRADRPQKGRYREFYQCDADALGSHSLVYDAECIMMLADAIAPFSPPEVRIRVNNRKILAGMAEVAGAVEALSSITAALDKLDKTSTEQVLQELRQLGLTDHAIDTLSRFMEQLQASAVDLNRLREQLSGSEQGLQGVEELRQVLQFLEQGHPQAAQWTLAAPLLARGLEYYTGTIFEMDLPGSGVGSVGSGGRYDELTALFGMKDMPGVGVSFGLDRLVDALQTLDRLPDVAASPSEALIIHFGADTLPESMALAAELRARDIAVEVYPDPQKMKKQLGYADKQGIPLVLLAGPGELERGVVQLKDLRAGAQEEISRQEVADRVLQRR